MWLSRIKLSQKWACSERKAQIQEGSFTLKSHLIRDQAWIMPKMIKHESGGSWFAQERY